MSSLLYQESSRHLEQLRADALQRATQDAIAAAAPLIQRQTALLFESALQGEQPKPEEPVAEEPAAQTPEAEVVSTTPTVKPELTPPASPEEASTEVITTSPDNTWVDVVKDLLAAPAAHDAEATLPPGTETETTTTVEIEVPDEALTGLPATGSADPAALGAPATSSPASSPETLAEAIDLSGHSTEDLLQEVFNAPDNATFDLMQTQPQVPTPAPARTFAQVLKESLEALPPLPDEATPEEPTAEFTPEIAPASPEQTSAPETAPEGEPADVSQLADALASLAGPAEPAAETAPEVAPAEPSAEGAAPDTFAGLNEEQVAALQEAFGKLNEGVMVLAAKNKNQAAELKLLKEQMAQRDTQLNMVKGYLLEAATLTSKTALANQLLMEHTTTKEEKVLIMESMAGATTRQEAESMHGILQGKLQKNLLLTEQKTAEQPLGAVFTSESGLLQESVHRDVTTEAQHPMAQRWATQATYRSKK